MQGEWELANGDWENARARATPFTNSHSPFTRIPIF